MRKTEVALACAVLLAFPAFTLAWSGQVVAVHDGDTISVMNSRHIVRVRLFGIDCPEYGQEFSAEATRFTADFALGKMAEIVPLDRDDYGRLVAWVSVDGKSLNKELVRAGLAWWYRHYAEGNLELKNLEAEAREHKVGLWSHPDPVPPWSFRRENRSGGLN